MMRVRNRTLRPLRLHLPDGKLLHLGPLQTGRVADKALERGSIRELIDDEVLELLDERPGGEAGGTAAGSGATRPAHEETHGHHPPSTVNVRGNR